MALGHSCESRTHSSHVRALWISRGWIAVAHSLYYEVKRDWHFFLILTKYVFEKKVTGNTQRIKAGAGRHFQEDNYW